jgi:hypothetical protein
LCFYSAFAQKADFVVAANGSGNFRTVQEAKLVATVNRSKVKVYTTSQIFREWDPKINQ